MSKHNRFNTFKRLIFYFGGFFVTAAGITTILRSTLGAGAWDTVNSNLHEATGITLGTASMAINITLLLIIILYHREKKFFFAFIPIIAIGLFIDLWDQVIYDTFAIETFPVRAVFYLVGTFLLTTGLSLTIVSGYPAMVFDELTIILMKVFKTESFFKSRLFIELFAIFLASLIGFTAGIGFGAVNVGSFILAVILPPILDREIKLIRPIVPFEPRNT
ncbi:MAG: YczE/YyaS/YitT family protein [Bacillota bacterium]